MDWGSEQTLELNVGGIHVKVSRKVLEAASEKTREIAHKLTSSEEEVRLDREWRFFSPVLQFIRTGLVIIDESCWKGVVSEAIFWHISQVADAVRGRLSSTCDPTELTFDSNVASLLRSSQWEAKCAEQIPKALVEKATGFSPLDPDHSSYNSLRISCSALLADYSRLELQKLLASVPCNSGNGARLRGTILQGLWLNNLDFSYSDLSFCDLTGCLIVGALLTHCSIAHVKGPQLFACAVEAQHLNAQNSSLPDMIASWSDFSHSNFSKARLAGLQSTGSEFSHCNFTHSNVQYSELQKCRLRNVCLAYCDIHGSRFALSDWSCSDFQNANMELCSWNQCCLIDCILDGFDATKMSFSKTVIKASSCRNSNFEGLTLITLKLDHKIFSKKAQHSSSADADSDSSVVDDCGILEGDLFSAFDSCHFTNTLFSRCMMHAASFQNATIDKCDFSFTDLSSSTFASCKGKDCTFASAKMENSNLGFAVLERCDLRAATLPGLTLEHCTILEANIEDTNVASSKGAYFTLDGAQGSALMMPACILPSFSLRDAVVPKSDFAASKCPCSIFDGSTFSHSTFKQAVCCSSSFIGCNFSKCLFEGSDFRNSIFRNCDFSGSNIKSANFQNCDFANCNFTSSNLCGSALSFSNLSNCNFQKCNCSAMAMEYCLLDNADFTSASVPFVQATGCRGSGIKLHMVTGTAMCMSECAFTKASLTASFFASCNMESASFTECILSNSLFDESTASQCNFTRCNFLESRFSKADIRGTTFKQCSFGKTVNFFGADLKCSEFVQTSLANVNVGDAELAGCLFDGANVEPQNLLQVFGRADVVAPAVNIDIQMEVRVRQLDMEEIASEADNAQMFVSFEDEDKQKLLRSCGIENDLLENFLAVSKDRGYILPKEFKSDRVANDALQRMSASIVHGVDDDDEILEEYLPLVMDGEVEIKAVSQHCPSLVATRWTGQTIENFDFRGFDLSLASFHSSVLKHCNFDDVSLFGASFAQCRLIECTFRNSGFQGSEWTGASIESCDIDIAKLLHLGRKSTPKLSICGSIAVGHCRFQGIRLSQMSLRNLEINSVDMSGVAIEGVCMVGIRFTNVAMAGSSLCGSDLSNATLVQVDLSGADLRRCNLTGAQYQEVRFPRCKLSGAKCDYFECLHCSMAFTRELNNPTACRTHSDVWSSRGYWICCKNSDPKHSGCQVQAHKAKRKLPPHLVQQPNQAS